MTGPSATFSVNGRRRCSSRGRLAALGRGRGGRGRFGLVTLVASSALLQGAGSELMLALIALAAEAGRPTGRALGCGLFRQQLEQDDVPAVADAEVAGLDDAGVPA